MKEERRAPCFGTKSNDKSIKETEGDDYRGRHPRLCLVRQVGLRAASSTKNRTSYHEIKNRARFGARQDKTGGEGRWKPAPFVSSEGIPVARCVQIKKDKSNKQQSVRRKDVGEQHQQTKTGPSGKRGRGGSGGSGDPHLCVGRGDSS